MTEEEQKILDHLVDAWNAWIRLDKRDEDDNDEFRRAIHAAQMSIALRIARRMNLGVWRQPD